VPTEPNGRSRLTLDRIVGDRGDFGRHAWGEQPWRHRTDLCPAELDALLDVRGIERILDASVRTPFVRLVRADRTIPTSEYVMRARMAGELLDDVVDPLAVHRAFADGATIVLQGLQRIWHPLVVAALELERELGHPVQVNAYLTPADAAGLGRHADRHDVFVVQLSGTKRWWVDGLGELTLAPGDALYLPLGVLHDARTGPRHSLHLTIGVPRITYRDVLRRWLDGVALDVLDAPLPIGHHAGTGPEAAGDLAFRFAALAEAAVAIASDTDRVEAVAGAEARRQRERRRPVLDGRLANAADPPTVEAWTQLRTRDGVRVDVDDEPDADGRCVVRADGSTLRMPWAAHAAMTEVRDARVVSAPALSPLSEASALVLLRRLVREGVLVPD
jgi:lysine-specific demethylase/histidyl-hydroxylase NO66